MHDHFSVHYLPCFATRCTTLHATLIGYNLVAICIGIMHALCISNSQSFGNDEFSSLLVSFSWRQGGADAIQSNAAISKAEQGETGWGPQE